MKGCMVLGFPKCGTTSLIEYLQAKYKMEIAEQRGFYPDDFVNKISRREWCYLPFEEQIALFTHEFGDPEDYRICFITRDPVERIWSAWEAWNHYLDGYTFEDYLKIDSEEYMKKSKGKGLSLHGEINPVKQVDYKTLLAPWLDNYPEQVIIYKLEKICKDPLFPQTNSLKKKEVPDEYREMILRAL